MENISHGEGPETEGRPSPALRLGECQRLPFELWQLIARGISSKILSNAVLVCREMSTSIQPLITERRKNAAASKIQKWWKVHRPHPRQKEFYAHIQRFYHPHPVPTNTNLFLSYLLSVEKFGQIYEIRTEDKCLDLTRLVPFTCVNLGELECDGDIMVRKFGDVIAGFEIKAKNLHSINFLVKDHQMILAKWRGTWPAGQKKRILLSHPVFAFNFPYHFLHLNFNPEAEVEIVAVFCAMMDGKQKRRLLLKYPDCCEWRRLYPGKLHFE
jgi:hypothetical protein